jgi:hypothetical protein
MASDQAPGQGARPPGDYGRDVSHEGGWEELEESGIAAVTATAAMRGESKVATGWLPTWG